MLDTDASFGDDDKNLILNIKYLNESLLIEFVGKIDERNSSFLKNTLEDLLSKHHKIIMDLSNLNYMASIGFSLLNAFFKKTKALDDGEMVLFGLQEKVIKVFKLLGFLSLFNIKDSQDEALEYINSKKASK